MSPESYVLLLIACWLLLASATLWGILRITRRHYLEYPETESPVAEPQEEPPIPARTAFSFTPAISRLKSLVRTSIVSLHFFQRRTSSD